LRKGRSSLTKRKKGNIKEPPGVTNTQRIRLNTVVFEGKEAKERRREDEGVAK
jgi:hypothetical protein